MKRPSSQNGTARDPGVLRIRKLTWKHDLEPAHAFQVCKNALALFDATRSLHALGAADRRLLHAAALLHDIGHTVEAAGHHKHSRDLIMKLDLPAFSNREKRIVACVARYHRKSHPAPKHAVFSDLNKTEQQRVEKLAALLRIADGLDRCHEASCKRIAAQRAGKTLTIRVEQRRPSPIDLTGAQRKQTLFEEVFGVNVKIEAVAESKPTKRAAS